MSHVFQCNIFQRNVFQNACGTDAHVFQCNVFQQNVFQNTCNTVAPSTSAGGDTSTSWNPDWCRYAYPELWEQKERAEENARALDIGLVRALERAADTLCSPGIEHIEARHIDLLLEAFRRAADLHSPMGAISYARHLDRLTQALQAHLDAIEEDDIETLILQ